MDIRTANPTKSRLLFVDDEQRVLNSMRIMFRRKFDLYFASHGAEALDIVKDNNIDVIIADHRMPNMTGVEVLSAVRTISPQTVRILLTGYADLDAVEGSINDSEVFRFLTKPCAPSHLRETIELAANVARESAGRQAPPELERPPRSEFVPATKRDMKECHTSTVILENTSVVNQSVESLRNQEVQANPDAGVIVFTDDDKVQDAVQKAGRGRIPIYHARTIVKVVRLIEEHRPGVLITDISEDKATLQAMTAQLKEHLPELVTIAISEHRDVMDMVWLINHGQIFRFLRKPLSPGRCAISLQSALQHHDTLLSNPEQIRRHKVEESVEPDFLAGVFSKLNSVRQLWAS